MKNTIIKIETEKRLPAEINGKRLRGATDRAWFYAAVALLAFGVVWLTIHVLLPILGIVLGLVFALIGVGIVVAVLVPAYPGSTVFIAAIR